MSDPGPVIYWSDGLVVIANMGMRREKASERESDVGPLAGLHHWETERRGVVFSVARSLARIIF